MNVATINEEPLAKKIRELQEQIEHLVRELASSKERELEKNLHIQVSSVLGEMAKQRMCFMVHACEND